jgi:hypothetical protein
MHAQPQSMQPTNSRSICSKKTAGTSCCLAWERNELGQVRAMQICKRHGWRQNLYVHTCCESCGQSVLISRQDVCTRTTYTGQDVPTRPGGKRHPFRLTCVVAQKKHCRATIAIYHNQINQAAQCPCDRKENHDLESR